MSITRPAARRLLCSVASPTCSRSPIPAASSSRWRSFHSSKQLSARRRPRFQNVRAQEMGLITEKDVDTFTDKHFPGYTPEEKEALGKIYSKEQMEALEAAEKAINRRDLTVQGRLRVDIARPNYVDDYSTIDPVLDKRVKKGSPEVIDATFMSPDEFTDDYVKWLDSFVPKNVDLKDLTDEQLVELAEKHGPTDVDALKYLFERSSLTGGASPGDTALAPELGRDIPGVTELYKRQIDPADKGRDEEGIFDETKRKTGMTLHEINEIKIKILVTRWVSNQTRLGKIRSTSVMAIAGNGHGRLGLGIAKSTEPDVATQKAKLAAIQNMLPIMRYENRTIYGNAEAKVSGTVVQLFSRPPGFGLRVPHRIFEICRAVGIHDLAAKIPRSRCPMNTVKATIQALTNQRNPEEIAIGRGKKLVDVRKVYYGGAVY